MSNLAYLDKKGNVTFRKSKARCVIGIVQEVKPNGDVMVLTRYASDKDEPQMEACELYDEIKREKMRRGD